MQITDTLTSSDSNECCSIWLLTRHFWLFQSVYRSSSKETEVLLHSTHIQVTGTPSMHMRKYLKMDDDDTDNRCCSSFGQKNIQALDLLFEPALRGLSLQRQAQLQSVFSAMVDLCWPSSLPSDWQDVDVTCFSQVQCLCLAWRYVVLRYDALVLSIPACKILLIFHKWKALRGDANTARWL